MTARLLLVSNRLPVTVRTERNEAVVTPSSGGLATGLRGPHERSDGLWIGWPGDVSRLRPDQRAHVDANLAALRCVPVYLTPADITRYYDGFSNAVLWPLFHYLLDRIPPTSQDFEVYRAVNERFADAVAARYQPGDLIWVHDYQLMLVPGMLRQRLPSAKIGFFLHIPFPASEILRILPWREAILEGLLGADLIGFHTFAYRSHFASSVLRILGIATDGGERVRHSGRQTRLGVFAMGVDSASFTALADDPEVLREAEAIRGDASSAHAPRARIFLGIDRLDYTKGIPRRLLAYERLLEREPALRGRVRLIQVGVPSRDKVESYQKYKATVNEMVGRINGAFGTVSSMPIHYVHRSFSQKQVVALYRAADVMLVTPLRDGMNLVAKEFVTSRTDEDGVLVLSEFAGAAAEMGEALQINPYDIERAAETYAQALFMPEEERRLRMRALRGRIVPRDVHGWARSFIETLQGEGAANERAPRKLSTVQALDAVADKLRSAERLLLILDYDGTLVPFAAAPELAAPDRNLSRLLAALADKPNIELHIVSGRKRETMDRWLGRLPVGLHAEHGFWSRLGPSEEWRALREVGVAWKDEVRRVIERYAVTTPGSLIEEKTACMAWHYRMAEPELGATRAEDLTRELEPLMIGHEPGAGGSGGEALELLRGERVIEVRLRGVNNAATVERLRPSLARATVIGAMGDDQTDDDLFLALPDDAITVSVGFRSSAAKYRVPRPADARALLERIL